jgi:hypothetical protein
MREHNNTSTESSLRDSPDAPLYIETALVMNESINNTT